jgi:hypothetical protein
MILNHKMMRDKKIEIKAIKKGLKTKQIAIKE